MAAAKSSKPHRSPYSPALGLRLLLLAGLSILLQYIDHRDNHLDTVRKAIGATVYPLRVIVDAPVSAWRWFDETTTSRNILQLENSRLRVERLLTQARLQRYSALEAENARLRAMLEARSQVRAQVRVAEIMSVSANPFRHVMVVDKGTSDGVYDGQAIVDAEGVVGQVIEAGVASSQCLLISDPGHDLPVEVNRSGLRTIARGTGDYNSLDLPFLPNNADIEPGDLLVTSGLGGSFPAGYPVAIVETVTRLPQEPFAYVTARPSAALNQVREIMLIWSDDDELEAAEQSAADDIEETADDEAARNEPDSDQPEEDQPTDDAESAEEPDSTDNTDEESAGE
ncbi:MAG: rod shape-determining protein MreC [Gammaproteobacteria bacterium]|nr:rod shape-determining protein MreC [Gammaproteobacteria bacterium]